MSDPAAPVVCAVLVTYHPDPAVLLEAVSAIRPQVHSLVVVDNGGTPPLPAGVEVLRQDGNVGLAAAQNAGIGWARARGATHVLVLDQDSVPAADMVAQLRAGLQRLSSQGRVAAVGPRYRDPRESRDAPFIKVAFPMSRKLWCDPQSPDIETDFLISSGALIPMSVLDDVGDMDAGIFIDNVDMEWSFRARSKGYTLYGVCAATMEHTLGDAREPVFGGAARVVRHGPVRLYFIMRNRVALYRRPYTPRVWIAQDVPRVFVKFAIFSVLAGPRLRNIRYMLRGLADGVRGRTGPCPLEARS
ncbi:MAG TPA: glycosyltransferase family 2 protein [Jatrophihabitantaceae bacterium]|nr:glycosyltransferase family 2 protein [Jatrophihabitantaceae bacterium]